eukprot:COSAG03_NODE_231_length_10288_cov_49.012170_4_plen_135_part_00
MVNQAFATLTYTVVLESLGTGCIGSTETEKLGELGLAGVRPRPTVLYASSKPSSLPSPSSLSGLTRNMFVNISQFHSSPSKPVEAVPAGNHSDYVRRKFLEPYAPAWHSRTLRIPYSSATCGREAEVRNDARQC